MSNTYTPAEARTQAVVQVFAAQADFFLRLRPADSALAVAQASRDLSYMYDADNVRRYSDAEIETAAAGWLRGKDAARPVFADA